MNARTAKKTQFSTLLKRSSCLASIGFTFSCCCSQAQENVFRPVSIQLPAVTTVPVPGASKPVSDNSAASQTNDEAERAKALENASKDDGISKGSEPKPKNREPIVLPSLSIPNTSLQGMGTGATPEDVVEGRLPPQIPLPYGADRYGFWALDSKNWIAPVFCHPPLYFEDVMLERNGQERFPCVQPLVSGARFFSNIAFLPYKSYLQRPLEERYSTGYYRPGSTAPVFANVHHTTLEQCDSNCSQPERPSWLVSPSFLWILWSTEPSKVSLRRDSAILHLGS